MDESGFHGLGLKEKMRVVAPRQKRRGRGARSWEQGYREHWSFCACVNAENEHLPGWWILQNKGNLRLDSLELILRHALPHTVVRTSGHFSTVHAPLNFVPPNPLSRRDWAHE